MNSHSEPESPLPPDELFVDSALLEKARLDGEKNDEVLIHSILLKTVERHFAMKRFIYRQQQTGNRGL